jgi:hypothetical protein
MERKNTVTSISWGRAIKVPIPVVDKKTIAQLSRKEYDEIKTQSQVVYQVLGYDRI